MHSKPHSNSHLPHTITQDTNRKQLKERKNKAKKYRGMEKINGPKVRKA